MKSAIDVKRAIVDEAARVIVGMTEGAAKMYARNAGVEVQFRECPYLIDLGQFDPLRVIAIVAAGVVRVATVG